MTKKLIRVKALLIKGRKTFVLRWPVANGKFQDETTDIPALEKNRRKACDAARDKEDHLNGLASGELWEAFEERYEEDWLPGRRPGTRIAWNTAVASLRAFDRETEAGIAYVTQVDRDTLDRWVAWMRRKQLSEATVRSYLGILRAALGWAADVGILKQVPRFPKIAGARKMRGRPLTEEELERMQAAAHHIRPRQAEEWSRLLRALWLSGLRISEALDLTWDWDGMFCVDLDASSFAIRKQKSGRAEYAPITPDFLEFLKQTPETDRVGKVFLLSVTPNEASRVISRIGKKALVVTTDTGRHATAHDLRRSFGSRWSQKVHLPVLQRLMRHADADTTIRFYVRLDSSHIAHQLQLGEEKGEIKSRSHPAENPKSNADGRI
jgi:integrase